MNQPKLHSVVVLLLVTLFSISVTVVNAAAIKTKTAEEKFDSNNLQPTPIGLLPKYCIHVVPHNSHVKYFEEGLIVNHPDGKQETHIFHPNCKQHVQNLLNPPRKQRPILNTRKKPLSNSRFGPVPWQAYATYEYSKEIQSLTGQWEMPLKPKWYENGPNFHGLGTASTSKDGTVDQWLESTLQFGFSDAGGGMWWSIVSGFVHNNGWTNAGAHQILDNDTIVSNITMISSGTWQITTIAITSGVQTTFNVNNITPLNWAVIAAYATAGILDCDGLPLGTEPFSNVIINKGKVVANWLGYTQNRCGQQVLVQCDPPIVAINYDGYCC